MLNFTFVNILITFITTCVAQSDWYTGRATFYGNEHWLWNIHEGSCGYYYLCPEEGTGWDVTALPDAHWGYQGSCGRCYEIKCNPSWFKDNYGETLDRSYQCYDSSASVIVTVTDTCPCNYPTNAYSNERWCCGDMDHLDVSVWAFEKLAELRWGVIGLSYREVPCDYQPEKVAPEPPTPYPPSPIPEGTTCPKGNFPLKYNWQSVQQDYRRRHAEAGAGSYANPPAAPAPSNTNEPEQQSYDDNDNKNYEQNYDNKDDYKTYDEQVPEEYEEQSTDTENNYDDGEQQEPVYQDFYDAFSIGPIEPRDPYPQEKVMFRDSFENGWEAAWFMADLVEADGQGLDGGKALCATIEPTGFIGIRGVVGQIVGSVSLELWVKDTGSMFGPSIDIDVGGPQGFCDPVNIQSLFSSGEQAGYTRYDIYLGLFDSAAGYDQSNVVLAFASTFQGCGQLEASTMNAITMQNNQEYVQTVCFDDIKLLG